MSASGRQRLDQLLVDRGMVESRAKAQALVLAGLVLVDGQKAAKPGHSISPESRIELVEKQRYVSRGGFKLEGALAQFKIDPTGRVCADIGASTGGFTDCLLQHGAARVYTFDVGTGQLDWKIRQDPRVIARERVNARYLTAEDAAEPVSLITFDVSFISVTLVIPPAVNLLEPHGEMVILVKPQFEAGKGQVGKGGIVRDPGLHIQACVRVTRVVEEMGFVTSVMDSPILGAEGNREFLLYARR